MCPGHEPALECPKQYAGKLEHGELGHKLYAACIKKKNLKKIRSEQDLNLRGDIQAPHNLYTG